MQLDKIQNWINQNPALAPWVIGGAFVVLGLATYLIARFLIARILLYVATRTENKYDDIIVEELRPFRLAWIALLLTIYYFAGLLPEATGLIRHIVSFLILWLLIVTANSLLNAVNAIYEGSSFYRGESIQGYLDLAKIILILVGITVTISLFTGKSPLVLLSGLGAAMAILVLIFRDTILCFVASVQIQSQDLINEGDCIEVPSYGADGDVLNISLHSVKIQNWDKTFTVIPTYKLVEVPYKNWRGMEESGGRRVKRAIHLDVTSIKFCDRELLERLQKIDLIKDFVAARLAASEPSDGEGGNNADPFQQCTNLDAFREYVANYLKLRPDIHKEGMTLLVRQLAPSPTGLPLEVYGFTKTTDWIEYETIQAETFSHLVAAAPQFDLRLFQGSRGGSLSPRRLADR